ncbi:hypothetical protein BTR22_19210 [Alkalihalophilus pseudofirmus]|uniref:phage major tail tube protein n=1 Tax=Alkalihalophilus pseudofirmus TaxID=79885 RepID=UPI000951B589|nr:hypothetical protein BTR22_19210 [Alkalihalophilus pseudofirmus]
MSTIPDKLINYNVYSDEEKLVGVQAETTLPNFENMTETLSGAGILGEIETPTLGHFGSQTMELSFRTIGDQTFKFMENEEQTITLRAAQQSYDTTRGQIQARGLKVVVKGMSKGSNLGTFAPNQATSTTATIEVAYIKVEHDGNVLLEFDKFNAIYVVNGKDLLADVRNYL